MDLTITLPAQEMQMVWNALMEIPGKHTYAIARKMEAQLAAQGALSAASEPGKIDETAAPAAR